MKTISMNDFIFRIYENPILQNISRNTIILHVKSVVKMLNIPAILEEKRAILNVINYRVKVPSDVYMIKSVMAPNVAGKNKRLISSQDDRIQMQHEYRDKFLSAAQYKHVGDFIYADFESGEIEIIYTAYTVDNEGLPLIPDVESLILAMENYIKVRHFTVAVETGNMAAHILDRAEMQYEWYMAQAHNELYTPTPEETESLSNAIMTLLPRTMEHDSNFKFAGVPEVLKKQ